MKNINVIIIEGVEYEYVVDRPKRENCTHCDLKEKCEECLGVDSMLCKLFGMDKNGYMKKVEK